MHMKNSLYEKKNIYIYIEVGLLHSMKPLVSWGVTGSDELPPGIPSAIGLPVFRLRAISSAFVSGGGAGPPPVLRASAFFLLAE